MESALGEEAVEERGVREHTHDRGRWNVQEGSGVSEAAGDVVQQPVGLHRGNERMHAVPPHVDVSEPHAAVLGR
jgi:hypothetical protein